MRRLALAVLALAALAAFAGAAPRTAVPATEKVVYEIPSLRSARVVLGAVQSHLDASRGTAMIAVVVHGGGVEAMLSGARDEKGVPYEEAVRRLAGRGVDFAVCGATLKLRHIDQSRVIGAGRIVDGGNAEIARRLSEGYARLN